MSAGAGRAASRLTALEVPEGGSRAATLSPLGLGHWESEGQCLELPNLFNCLIYSNTQPLFIPPFPAPPPSPFGSLESYFDHSIWGQGIGTL